MIDFSGSDKSNSFYRATKAQLNKACGPKLLTGKSALPNTCDRPRRRDVKAFVGEIYPHWIFLQLRRPADRKPVGSSSKHEARLFGRVGHLIAVTKMAEFNI
jgi:hypothetical protein